MDANTQPQVKMRSRIVPVRVTDKMYKELQKAAENLDLPVATYCYLAVIKSLTGFTLSPSRDDEAAESLIP